MNFPRFNKMKGMGQIVTWSVRDETLHCLSMIKLFNAFVAENPDIWDDQLQGAKSPIAAAPSSASRTRSSISPSNRAASRVSSRRMSKTTSVTSATAACSSSI
jgi:hypothetical protein